MMKGIGLVVLVGCVLISGCATTPPSNPNDMCDIFEEKSSWYKHARNAQKRWGSPIPVMMSIMFQESQYRHNVRPARKKILWIIPGPRPSNAFGYPQAKNDVWNEYRNSTGNDWARRDNFKDAIDFIGWYNRQSQLRSKIPLNDGYRLYLAYHEGQGGYNRGSYQKKPWLIRTAKTVSSRAGQYAFQLKKCEDSLQRWWWPF
jgi:hypothetical protein